MRLFVAVWPPAPVVAAVASLGSDVVRVRPERLHVTLRFLGEADPVVVAGQLRAVRLPAATAVLGPVTATFGRGRVVHVPVDGLARLAAAVDPAPDRPFVGHLTVARARGRERLAGGTPVPPGGRVPWPVEEVTLVASAGGRYEVLERFATA